MYWQIGKRIREEVLQNQRADYGKQTLSTLSGQLTTEYGKGFGQRNLEQMVRFAEVFPDSQIAQTLSAQLSWSHFTEIIRLDTQLKRDFYAEMCRAERWSVRTLRHKIGYREQRGCHSITFLSPSSCPGVFVPGVLFHRRPARIRGSPIDSEKGSSGTAIAFGLCLILGTLRQYSRGQLKANSSDRAWLGRPFLDPNRRWQFDDV